MIRIFPASLLALSVCLLLQASARLAGEEEPPPLPKPPPLPPEMRENRPQGPPPDLPDPSDLIDQLKQLEELLSLSPEKLQRLRQTLEFIEKMSPQEREAMRIRLAQVTQMTAERKKEIKELMRHLPDIEKSDFTQFWLAANSDTRATIRSKLEELPAEEGSAFLQARVLDFIEKRDEAFARMRSSLEEKRDQLEAPKP
ncbi:MAG: DUF3106 domain-containing protein [Oceanipulchritudo sp.]